MYLRAVTFLPALFVYSTGENVMLPAASLVAVAITTLSLSFNSKLNSLAFNSRPSKRLVKLKSTEIGTLFTRFSVGLLGFSTVLEVGL